MDRPDPAFAVGDDAIYEDPHLGDRAVTITGRTWESYTETWTYTHETKDTGHQTIGHHAESHYRRSEDEAK
jgi:hypothetical protein